MNIRGEKIEQLIQAINRHLKRSYIDEVSNIFEEYKKLQANDWRAFGNDRFAFEMLQYVESGRGQNVEGTLAQNWDKIFQKGLETLLVECAVSKDTVERDCFVSRVFCWFNEKLVERKNLPVAQERSLITISRLKENISDNIEKTKHTIKGLENFAASKRSPLKTTTKTDYNFYGNDDNDDDVLDVANDITHDITSSTRGFLRQSASANALLSSTDEFSRVNATFSASSAFLTIQPSIMNQNYGMIYNKPESEEERAMNELWLARRRQEAFSWKAQQQMNITMDRLQLVNSRRHHEALRREEASASLLQSRETRLRRSQTATALFQSIDNANQANADHELLIEDSSLEKDGLKGTIGDRDMPNEDNKMVETSSLRCKIRDQPFSPDPSNTETLGRVWGTRPGEEARPMSLPGRRMRLFQVLQDSQRVQLSNFASTIVESDAAAAEQMSSEGSGAGTLRSPAVKISLMRNGKEEMQAYVPPLTRQTTVSPSFLPMKFKSDMPSAYNRMQPYMTQLNDSDDEDRHDNSYVISARDATRRGSNVAPGCPSTAKGLPAGAANKSSGKGKGKAQSQILQFKHDKPVMRDRPQSAKAFHSIAKEDPELKVIYRYTNYRRMPMTAEQREWLAMRQIRREKTSQNVAQQLVASALEANQKSKKDGKKNEAGKKQKKDGKKLDAKLLAAEHGRAKKRAVSLYASAADFMSVNFPNFDSLPNFDAPPLDKPNINEMEIGIGAMSSLKKASTAPAAISTIGGIPRQISTVRPTATGISSEPQSPRGIGAEVVGTGQATWVESVAAAYETGYGGLLEDHDFLFDDSVMGPMRAEQLRECTEIMRTTRSRGVLMNKNTLIRALVTPQDRPEAICLEEMRENGEGLMVNPIDKKYWRSFKESNTKKRKGGGKKKKK